MFDFVADVESQPRPPAQHPRGFCTSLDSETPGGASEGVVEPRSGDAWWCGTSASVLRPLPLLGAFIPSADPHLGGAVLSVGGLLWADKLFSV